MNMIASVLHLDRQAVKALKVTDAYSLHRVVYSLYEDIRDVEKKHGHVASGILYADQGGDIRGRKILMLANRSPKNAVNERYGEVLSKPIPKGFLEHEHYRFKVIVNPTRRDSASRKLVAVRGRDEIAQWFEERAITSWGFEPTAEHLQIDKVQVLQFRDKHQREVTIAQAHVQGKIRITDKDKFVRSFTQGIGRARAYGCGLLQVVPIVDDPFMGA